MSQKPCSGPYDYELYGPHLPPVPGPDAREQEYGDPTICTPDLAYGDPTIPTTPRTPGLPYDGDSTILKSAPSSVPGDTPAAPGIPALAAGISDHCGQYPIPPGVYYEPYANAYAPPPPDQTSNVPNPYDAYGPTMRSEYPPLPEAPTKPASRLLSHPFRQKGPGRLLLAALLALMVMGASALFLGVRFNHQATLNNAVQQTAVASTYPFSNRLILKDPLIGTDEATYGWDNNGQSCFFGNSAYHDAYKQPGYYKPCIAADTNFSNFTFQAQMEIKQGDENVGGGLIFRADTSAYKFYRLFITTRGYYQLRVYVDRLGRDSRLLRDGVAPPFHAGLGQTNKIAISVYNDELSFYVNKQLVSRASDDTFSHGQIGFNLDNPTSQNAEVIFTNARVWLL